MKWFLVVALFGQPDGTADSLANVKYETREACWGDAPRRVLAMQSVGAHGRFFCMRERMPDAEMRRQPIGEF